MYKMIHTPNTGNRFVIEALIHSSRSAAYRLHIVIRSAIINHFVYKKSDNKTLFLI